MDQLSRQLPVPEPPNTIAMESKPDKPCDLCIGMVLSLIPNFGHNKTFNWYTKTSHLIESARTCQLCAAIWDLLLEPRSLEAESRFGDLQPDEDLSISVQLSNSARSSPSDAMRWASLETLLKVERHSFHYLTEGVIGVSIEDHLRYPDHHHPSFWTLGRIKPHLTVTEDRLQCAKEWLDSCENACGLHRQCEPSRGYLPKRLIDVRHGQPLQLVATATLALTPGGIRYATLSHCWGEYKLPKTTKSTEGVFEEAISKNQLPKTFRDAITVTRSLGIPYLWIDSLCIVQDDPDEWQVEVSRMNDVYAGSVLTIAASDGKDSRDGFLPEEHGAVKSASDRSPLQKGARYGGNHDSAGGAGKNTRTFSFEYQDKPNRWPKNIMVHVQALKPEAQRRRAHLSTRGWTFQEQVLSHRVLHCLDSELHWQCRQSYQTQSGHVSEETGSEYGLDVKYGATVPQTGMWSKWVEDYSRRDFTVASDRMPAYAGISSYYKSLTGEEPYLGIRRMSLATDLSWLRAGSERGPAGLSAPSWTWLSCNAPIWVDRWCFENEKADEVEDHVSSVTCRVDWAGPAMASAIEATVFRVRGPVKELTIQVAPEAKDYNPPYFLVEREKSDFSESSRPWNCAGQFDSQSHLADTETTYTCLLLRSRKREEPDRYRETFLILVPTVEMVELSDGDVIECPGFRRVGVAMIRGSERTFENAEVRELELF